MDIDLKYEVETAMKILLEILHAIFAKENTQEQASLQTRSEEEDSYDWWFWY